MPPQVLGFTLLQHLVGGRWEEFSTEEQRQLATLAYGMLKQGEAFLSFLYCLLSWRLGRGGAGPRLLLGCRSWGL